MFRALVLEDFVTLSQLIHRRKDTIIQQWADKVATRLGLEDQALPQLINDLPQVLDDIAEVLEEPRDTLDVAGAQAHGRQRVECGVDIGGLAEEFGMITETILEVASVADMQPTTNEMLLLLRSISRACAQSVREYARFRDAQLESEAARHFSFVAHELRTPLQAAQLAVHLLSDGIGESNSHLERLRRAHDQLSELVDGSLVEARLKGEPQLRLNACRLLEIAREAVDNARLTAERKEIELHVQADDTELWVDRKLIVSALTNLVVNGVKFSRPEGCVTLRAQSRPDRTLFEVEDECGGLEETQIPRLFQPFVQGGADRSGFGLGLMIVKQAVEAHGGAVRVVNRPSQGCTFVVEIPTASPPEA